MSRGKQGDRDAFYTPPWLACELVDCLPHDLEGAVLDPTVGGGALLSAVRDRFRENVVAVGIDIDQQTVRRLQSAQPDWVLSCADLLSSASRRNSRAWRLAKAGVAAVVVNPPFSYRGAQGAIVSFGNFYGRVAPAMQFLVELMVELSPTAGFYAILPDGALEAEKHRELWAEIRRGFVVERLKRFKTSSFRGARVATSLVHLRPLGESDGDDEGGFPQTSAAIEPHRRGGRCSCVEVVRGRVPVHSVKGTFSPARPVVPFLHTTNLSQMHTADGLVAESRLADDAPLVLLARVGAWSDPVVVEIGRVVLSDCLFGLRPRDRAELDRLRADVEDAKSAFRALFKGTGAQYLTVSNLVEQLRTMGWHPHVVKASSPARGSCGDALDGSQAGPSSVCEADSPHLPLAPGGLVESR